MTTRQSQYLSTAQAAETLAVSVSTVKRWVDEGILPAHVTAGGHRKLQRAEVLALIRQGRLPEGEPVLSGQSGRNGRNADPSDVSAALLAALTAGDSRAATTIVRKACDAGLPIEILADRVIAPAMASVGHQWEEGRLDVWQEHRGTEACVAAVHDLKRQLESRTEKDRPVALGGAPEGDHYVLPSQLAQIVLIDAGWAAVNLGPNTPLSSLIKALRKLRPRLLWLSVSYLKDVEEFVRSYRELYRAAEQLGVAVALGGRGLPSDLRSSLSYTTHGDGLSHLAAFARTLHPRLPRPRRGRPRPHHNS